MVLLVLIISQEYGLSIMRILYKFFYCERSDRFSVDISKMCHFKEATSSIHHLNFRIITCYYNIHIFHLIQRIFYSTMIISYELMHKYSVFPNQDTFQDIYGQNNIQWEFRVSLFP